MKNEEAFKAFFNKTLLPELNSYQEKRGSIVVLQKRMKVVALIASALVILSAVYNGEAGVLWLFIIVGMIYLAPILGKVQVINTEIRKKYKFNIFLATFKFFYKEVLYLPLQKFSLKTLQRSKLIMPSPGIRNGEDYIKVKVGNTIIQFCEIITYTRDQRGKASFEGIFCVAEFNKNFKSNTILLSKKNVGLRSLGTLGIKSLFGKGKTIQLEDPYFNNEYLIWGDDEVDARYILSPKLMQRILDYKKKLNVAVSISFTNNMAYFTIPLKRDLFDFTILKDVNSYKEIKKDIDYFLLFTDIVEDLDLNTRIWSKN